jgi:endoglucanase
MPAPTPAPTPAPGTVVLKATVKKDSTWNGGLCRSFTITNTGTRASTNWKLRFTLPASVKITDSWSGTASRSGNVVTVTAPSWAASVAPRTSVAAFGFCATGTGEPTAIGVTEVATTTTAVAPARSGKATQTRAVDKAKRIRHARQLAAGRA